MYLNNFYFLNENQLLKHAGFLRNKTLDELSQLLLVSLPYNLKKNKGIIGQLIELFLGIKNNNKTQPDFPNLGIELKNSCY
ncbi:hypothetical protein HIC20_00660 [Buchnera aphidicola (Hormaphis cornu)]|nr:hypothetical protein HIC20_00660 [Buchnera aphidicola (Hormaphis cornu)]